MITDKFLAEQFVDGELAKVSLMFWRLYDKPISNITPDHPVWKELKAFQAGWITCRNYNMLNKDKDERPST